MLRFLGIAVVNLNTSVLDGKTKGTNKVWILKEFIVPMACMLNKKSDTHKG